MFCMKSIIVCDINVPIGQIRNPELESGFGGRWIISSGGMARSARGFGGIFGPPICLTRTRPPAFLPMVATNYLMVGRGRGLSGMLWAVGGRRAAAAANHAATWQKRCGLPPSTWQMIEDGALNPPATWQNRNSGDLIHPTSGR